MSRHDKENVDSLGIKEEEYLVTNFHSSGNQSVGFSNSKDIVLKEIKNPSNNFTRYIAKIIGGQLYDPFSKDVRYDKKDWKFRTISKDVMDLYLQYLGFKSQVNKGKKQFLLKAERLLWEN